MAGGGTADRCFHPFGLTYRRDIGSTSGTSREELPRSVALRQCRPPVAWRYRARRRGRHRLFHGGSVWPRLSRQAWRRGRLLAGCGHRHWGANRAWTGCTFTGGGCRSSRNDYIQALDDREPLARHHFRHRLRRSDSSHGLADRALVWSRIQARGCAPGAGVLGGERGWSSYGCSWRCGCGQPCPIGSIPTGRVAALVCVVLAGHGHGRTAADWTR